MITTTSELSRNLSSSPGASDSTVPPITPPRPASAAPMKNAPANTSWTLTPIAEVIARSSTPARTTMPKRVCRMTSQSTNPTATATPTTKTRNAGYCRS